MSETVNYTININGTAEAVVGKVLVNVNKAIPAVTTLGDKFRRLGEAAFALNNINSVLQQFSSALDGAVQPGVNLDTSMHDLSAITGVTGGKLKEIEGYARSAAKVFGGSAAQGVESYKLILSQLSPEIAKVPTALSSMGKSVSVLSKTMGGDTVAATEVLTTAMNQFQVSMDDPAAAAKVMADMMNVMSAAAKEGSAELPAIKAALENSGMAAKTAGVSFEELNAAIQVLDKAGKKGAEGGVAIRNALSILSEGRFMPEKTQEALKKAGVNVNALGDQSLKLSDRLRLLKPVMNDAALMTLLFGRENQNAGIALISGVDQIDEYTRKITGTNAANEQAQAVMSGFSEKMSRYKARWDDLKISIFQHAQQAIPAFKVAVFAAQGAAATLTVANTFGTISESSWFIALKERTKQMWKANTATWAGITSNGTWIGVSLLAAVATKALAASVRSLGTAIYSIPIIGWIALGITLLAGLFKYLWDHSEKFRQVLFGVWEAVKAVFHNIGVVVKVLWENLIKPIFMFIFNLWKAVIGGMISAVVWLWNGLVTVFSAVGAFLYDNIIMPVWNGITNVIEAVGGFFLSIWEWISTTFSGIATWLDKNLLEPIKGIFSKLWDFISGILDNIINALMKPIKWIKELWNKVFPKDQFQDVGVAYKVGVEKGSESWKKDHPDAATTKAGIKAPELPGAKPPKPTKEKPPTPTAKADAANAGGTRNNSISIQIKNMVGEMNFSGGVKENKEEIFKVIQEGVMRSLQAMAATA